MSTKLIVLRQDADGQVIDPTLAPKDEQAVAEFLKSKKSDIRSREGVFHGNRVEYFKGKRAIEALLSEAYPHKSRPKITSYDEAKECITSLMEQHNFFFRVEKQPKRVVEIDSKQYFEEDGYYVWQWESSWARTKSKIYSFLLIAVVLTLVMFPLWPSELRVGTWYLSMGALGLIGGLFVLAIIRLILFMLSLVLPMTRPGIWLFPNLFADVGVVDSFIPLWGWHGVDYESMHLKKYLKQKKGKKGKKSKSKDRSSVETNEEEPLLDVKGKGKAVAPASDDDDVEEIEAEERPRITEIE